MDFPSFEAAIAESLPDQKIINKLKAEIAKEKKALNRVNQELGQLVDAFLKGTLQRETIQKKEDELYKTKDKLTENLNSNLRRLKNMPNVEKVKKQADQIHKQLFKEYSGLKRYGKITYGEKRKLLHWIFEGHNLAGDRYGIYINRKSQGRDAIINYFLYGRIIGLRSIKGKYINYVQEKESSTNYKTKRTGFERL